MSEFLHEIVESRISSQQMREWRYSLVDTILSDDPWAEEENENA